MASKIKSWTTLNSHLVFDGSPWLQVYRDTVSTGDRIVDDFHRIKAADFALVYATVPGGRIVMLQQWRQGPGRISLCFPGGHVDSGESDAIAAMRELSEETGYTADAPHLAGRFSMHSNFGVGWGSFFIASGARRVAEPASDDLEAPDILLVTPEDLRQALHNGRISTMHDAICAQFGLAHTGRS